MDTTASPPAGSAGRKRSRSGGAAVIPETDGGSQSSSSSSPRSRPATSRGGLPGLLFERQRRGRLPPGGKPALLFHAERRAVAGARSAYVSLPPSTKSTIALAVSSCGRFVASTHGDHTVKVTEFHTGQLLHTLVGHARTPWTVKFHPQDSTLLCSGCIGGEVRLWSLPTGRCLRAATLDLPVISLAFHPGTPPQASVDGGGHQHQHQHLLAVATFHSLYLWPYARLEQPYHEWQSARLLRCVLFAPGGASLLLGLGNDSGPPRPPPQSPQPGAAGGAVPSYQLPPPRQGPKAFHLFLWSFNAGKALVPRAARPPPAPARPTGLYGRERNPGPPAYASPLSRPRPVLERALLYNDGGVDVGVGPDGAVFLVTCAELAPSDLPEGHEGGSSGSSGAHWPVRAHLVQVALPAAEEEGEDGSGGGSSKAGEEGEEEEAPAWATEDGDGGAAATAANEEQEQQQQQQQQQQHARRLLPPVLAARALDGVPPGGVTSVKLSGSGRLVLLGYGVRDRPYASYGGGGDDGPPHPVLDVFDAGRELAPLATVRTREDEDVNIARFHPFSAQGFLYGTKQGRLRVFMPGGRRSRGAGLVDVDEVDENEDEVG